MWSTETLILKINLVMWLFSIAWLQLFYNLKLTVLFLLDFEDGSKPANSRKKSERSKNSMAQKEITSKKEANTRKSTVASASCPTKTLLSLQTREYM